jgi:hypothetical protein
VLVVAGRAFRAGSFYKTADDRYIVKKINKEEWEDFTIIGPGYFDHVGGALYKRVPSCLVKVLGVYKLSFQREDRCEEHLLKIRSARRSYGMRRPVHLQPTAYSTCSVWTYDL